MRRIVRLTLSTAALICFAQAVAHAQSYDPKTQSPLTLLAVPKDALAYFDARTRAQLLLSQGKAAEAEPLAEQITREYPRDGENWLLLANAKRGVRKFAEAADAREKAGKLLEWGGGFPLVSAANERLMAGDTSAALDLLRRQVFGPGTRDRAVLDDDDFASLRTDPRFMEIAARPVTTGWSRNEGWRRDVDFLRNEVKRMNADYRDHELPPEFERRYNELKQNVPRISDEAVLVGMNRMLAVLHQGHTAIQPTRDSRVASKTLPFQFWVFPEGIFIVDAIEQHRDLVGARLVSIEGTPAEEALRKVNEMQSVDGDNEYLYVGAIRFRSTPFLVGLGIARSTDSVRLTVQKPDQPQRTVTVGTPSFAASFKLQPVPGVKEPLYLQEPKQLNWNKALPEHNALYVRVNMYDPAQAQNALRLRSLLVDQSPKNVILDMRFNDGGSTNMYAELLRTLIAFSTLPGRRVYVLIGRTTYSASGNFITELEQLADAVFVGEASSECCTLYGSPSNFRLPYSKLAGRMSTKRWSLSRKGNDFRRELNPHVPVMMTANDYFSGNDPVMETVFRLIAR